MRRNINHSNQEGFYREIIRDEVKNSPEPPLTVDEAWNRLNNERKKQQITTRQLPPFYKKTIAVACALVILGSMFFLSPNNGVAFSKVADVFQRVQGTVSQLFLSSETTEEQQPTSDDIIEIEGSSVTSIQVSLEEARENTSFPIRIPREIPEDFRLKDVTLLTKGDKLSDEVILNFTDGHRSFIINQKAAQGPFGIGLTTDSDDTTVEQIIINEKEASLIEYKDGFVRLIWLDQSFYFTISGELTKEEVITIAKTI